VAAGIGGFQCRYPHLHQHVGKVHVGAALNARSIALAAPLRRANAIPDASAPAPDTAAFVWVASVGCWAIRHSSTIRRYAVVPIERRLYHSDLSLLGTYRKIGRAILYCAAWVSSLIVTEWIARSPGLQQPRRSRRLVLPPFLRGYALARAVQPQWQPEIDALQQAASFIRVRP
jgi:hypothetical protein